MVELFAKSDVLIPCSLFICLSIVDVGSGRVPTHNASLLIAKGVVVNEEPSILTVFSQSALLELKGTASGESRLSVFSQPLDIVRVEDALAKARLRKVFHRKSGVVERRDLHTAQCQQDLGRRSPAEWRR